MNHHYYFSVEVDLKASRECQSSSDFLGLKLHEF